MDGVVELRVIGGTRASSLAGFERMRRGGPQGGADEAKISSEGAAFAAGRSAAVGLAYGHGKGMKLIEEAGLAVGWIGSEGLAR